MMNHKSSALFLFLINLALISSATANPKYITTIHPLKAILERIVGERGSVTGLLPPGASPHSFDISPSVMHETESADAIFFIGKDIDEWIIKTGNKNKIELLKLIPKDSLQHIFYLNSSGIKNIIGTDAHFWTDPLLVKNLLPSLVKELCKLDPDGCGIYKRNSEIFSNELLILVEKVSESLQNIKSRSVFLSHPFFQYYLNRFGFQVEGIIEPFSNKEPTPKELKRLIELGNKLSIGIILNNVQHQKVAAELVSESTGIPLIVMDPIGGVEGRISYEEIILFNTNLLLNALRRQ